MNGERGFDGEHGVDDVERIFREEPVEPLHPEPGTYERIVSEAHRRKRHSSAGRWLAAAAAVIVAGGAGVAYGLLNGDKGNSDITPAQSSTASVSTSSSSTPTTTAPTSTPSTSAPSTPAAAAIPGDFSPVDVSTAAQGRLYVLGTTACASGSCGISLATTSDGGTNWHGLSTPQGLGWTTQVREVRFAGDNGWLAGDELWATHDGGASWKQVDLGGAAVLALESNGSSVWAVVGNCPAAKNGERTCTSVRVLVANDDSDNFTQADGQFGVLEGRKVTAASISFGAGRQAAISVTTDQGERVWASPGDKSFAPLPTNPCPGGSGDGLSLSGRVPTSVLAAAGEKVLVALCGDPAAGNVAYTVRESTDSGQSWSTTGDRLRIGNGDTTFAAATGSELAVTMTSPDLGMAFKVSHDGGASWKDAAVTPSVDNPPQSVLAASATRYFVTTLAPLLYVSDDAGRTWRGWFFQNGSVGPLK